MKLSDTMRAHYLCQCQWKYGMVRVTRVERSRGSERKVRRETPVGKRPQVERLSIPLILHISQGQRWRLSRGLQVEYGRPRQNCRR